MASRPPRQRSAAELAAIRRAVAAKAAHVAAGKRAPLDLTNPKTDGSTANRPTPVAGGHFGLCPAATAKDAKCLCPILARLPTDVNPNDPNAAAKYAAPKTKPRYWDSNCLNEDYCHGFGLCGNCANVAMTDPTTTRAQRLRDMIAKQYQNQRAADVTRFDAEHFSGAVRGSIDMIRSVNSKLSTFDPAASARPPPSSLETPLETLHSEIVGMKRTLAFVIQDLSKLARLAGVMPLQWTSQTTPAGTPSPKRPRGGVATERSTPPKPPPSTSEVSDDDDVMWYETPEYRTAAVTLDSSPPTSSSDATSGSTADLSTTSVTPTSSTPTPPVLSKCVSTPQSPPHSFVFHQLHGPPHTLLARAVPAPSARSAAPPPPAAEGGPVGAGAFGALEATAEEILDSDEEDNEDGVLV